MGKLTHITVSHLTGISHARLFSADKLNTYAGVPLKIHMKTSELASGAFTKKQPCSLESKAIYHRSKIYFNFWALPNANEHQMLLYQQHHFRKFQLLFDFYIVPGAQMIAKLVTRWYMHLQRIRLRSSSVVLNWNFKQMIKAILTTTTGK